MKTILEIGGGRTPYFIRYRLPIETGTCYYCLDVSSEHLDMAKGKLDRHAAAGKPLPEEVYFITQDASNIPLKDASADAVIMSNVLTAPIHRSWDWGGTKVTYKNANGEKIERSINRAQHDDPFYAERKPLVDEALRILKPNGKLHIYTDLIIYGLHSYERLLRELAAHPQLNVRRNSEEEQRINQLNSEKIANDDNCCCFRAEVLPECAVYEFTKLA